MEQEQYFFVQVGSYRPFKDPPGPPPAICRFFTFSGVLCYFHQF